MTIRGLEIYLRERKLVQTCPISALANTRLGIDASYYLKHLLSDQDSREPLVASTGGLPLAMTSRIENDLRALERQGIKPVFIFSGLPLSSRPPPKGPDPQAERETQVKNEAWSYYENGQVERAIMQLTAIKNGAWTDWRDLMSTIPRVRPGEFIQTTSMVDKKLAYLLQHPKGYIHAIYSSTECLMWPVEKVITSTDWTTTFQFIDKSRLLGDINLTSEQFLDLSILAGSSLSRTFPPISNDFAIKTVIDLIRLHKSGVGVCHNWRAESQFKAQTYIDAFWKARLAIKFSLVLTTEGTCVPLPTVVAPQQQAFTIQDVPGDLDEIFSPRLPDETYFYICRGLISAQVVGWMTSGMIVEYQPLADCQEYRRFIKDVVTEGPTSPRCTTMALLADVLHPDWAKRRINAHYYYDMPYTSSMGALIPFTDPLTQSLVDRCSGWIVPMTHLESELRRQNSSTIDLKLCMGALVSDELAVQTRRDKSSRVLDKKDEIVANVIWRFMEVRGKWGDPNAEVLSGGPSFGSDEEQKSTLLIMRCLSILPLMFRPQQWAGPLSRELLVFNSFVRALSKSLRHLYEAVSVHILLSGDAKRNRDDYSDIMLSLPFQIDVNTGFGILAKTYLDAATFHHGDSITEENCTTSEAKQAKRDAMSFVEQSFSSVKSPIQEVERGFRFWDSVMVAIRCLDKEQGPSPPLSHSVVGRDVIEQFEKADKWLRPIRP
ncbi:hypothetical protein IAR55_005496 [Kwoniella newhampshirensis]|uniref:XPG domain-containing protein n=1 Tax=Kwoniella newhampshirensis TaxID=1651941 RepID=A0AAW0YHI6_9TREE